MPSVSANGIDITYDTLGNPQDPTILLIMGLSMQMIAWPDALCQDLASRGYYVIRFDNRDVGLSQKFEGVRSPNIIAAGAKALCGMKVDAPYTLDDMALDAVGLLDALERPEAHVVGVSMGGMIGQVMAAKHKASVRSLVSIMSSTGHPRYLMPRLRVVKGMFFDRPKSPKPEDLIEHMVKFWHVIGSPGFPVPEEEVRERLRQSIERSYTPQAYFRHLAAILASGHRRQLLRQVEAPTLVIHGTDDPMVPVAGGKDTANHIPGARLELIKGMGHNLPSPLLPRLGRLIGAHIDTIEGR